jgi:creatinine amidohydrolase/Fe(II)-dependent formamide hydrolase-like protein
MLPRSFVVVALTTTLLAIPPSASAQNSVYIEELTWTEVRDLIAAGRTTVILPTGGTEQSGPHMVLGKENFAVEFSAGEIAKRLGDALVAPTLAYVPEGNVDPPSGHMRYPGSITLPQETFVQVLLWAGRSFKVNGFKNIVLIGNSGGNQAGLKAAADVLNREWSGSGTRAHFANAYYDAGAPTAPVRESPYDRWLITQGEKPDTIGSHAGIRDTSTLMAVEAARFSKGQLVRWDKLAPRGGFANSGVSGDPTRASVERGKVGNELKIAAAVEQIKGLISGK